MSGGQHHQQHHGHPHHHQQPQQQQQHPQHQQSPSFHHRPSFSPTDRHDQPFHNSSHPPPPPNHPPYHPATANGHSAHPLPAATVYGTPSRSQYYDPVDRSGKLRSSWGHSARSPSPPPLQTESVSRQQLSVGVRDNHNRYVHEPPLLPQATVVGSGGGGIVGGGVVSGISGIVGSSGGVVVGAGGGLYQPPLEQRNSKGAVYPMSSPTAIVDQRRGPEMSSYLPNDQRSPLDMNMQHQPSYGPVKAEPSSPIATTALSTARRGGGAMSISALLSTAEDPPHPTPTAHPPRPPQPQLPLVTHPQRSNNHHATNPSSSIPSTHRIPHAATATSPSPSHRPHPLEKHQHQQLRTQEPTRQPLKQHIAASSRAAVAQYTHPYDADATDSDNEPAYQAAIKLSQASRDSKYLDPMDIDANVEATDTAEDSDEFTNQRRIYMIKNRKRQLALNCAEDVKRKRRFNKYQDQLCGQLEVVANNGRERGRSKFHDGAMAEVMAKEEEDEKERKKEQQRKRRREKAEMERRIKAEMAVKAAKEVAAQPPARRDRDEPPPPKIRRLEKPPMFEENIMDLGMDGPDSDVSGVPLEEEAGNRRIRKKPGPKKKLPPAPPSVPAEEPEVSAKVPEPAPREEYVPHTSKTYSQLYDQIWKDIARKEIPKLQRTQQTSLATKQANHRKTAQLAAKEAQRWKLRTTKNIKDTQARAKRSMREMLGFWKRNEREERDMRRRAEKEAMERAKKEEEVRESARQARKLNFLLTQTELYSHFVGKKIRTDAIEKSTGADAVAAPATDAKRDISQQLLSMAGQQSGGAVNFEDLDFDDEEALQKAAAANAKHHLQATKNAARAFNQPSGSEGGAMDLDEEMDFQNPAGMDDVDIEQPKMLNCTLKEYQLKGLNWLSNLYEQGINGILADEMGLGKTVQSISVMAYLAERHNIWGPFLVIAPSSTLHNWQQEISRFVPDFKVIPYWGGAKDRKILRKFWDRKTPVYTRDSPFHVLITSYQLVVQDAANFSQMKWQYMILDEAQAIKSSSSTRWKALLGFHCRNRLLLTGTPIQNSMQELWALLHFIMPSLFDSHDEFSEWFSKDIESHAQSNTQLNEKQLERLHMILKPFMLRRVKKHVQKELGDKIEKDVFCELTYRQRSLYRGLRDKISFMDLIEKAAAGDDNNQTLMNLVMQFRKVCNHPDLFERADVRSPLAFTSFAETGSFLRGGPILQVPYTARSLISYRVPKLVYRDGGRLDLPGSDSDHGLRKHILTNRFNIWKPDCIKASVDKERNSAFSWVLFSDTSPGEASKAFHHSLIDKFEALRQKRTPRFSVVYDDADGSWQPWYARLLVTDLAAREPIATATEGGVMASLLRISEDKVVDERFNCMDPLAFRAVSAPPIDLICHNQGAVIEQEQLLFNERTRRFLLGPNSLEDELLLENKVDPSEFLPPPMLPRPSLEKLAASHVQVPSMGRFVSDSGKLAELDRLLTELKAGGHRVLLYFQMTRMMDLCEEYLTYRHHRYLRLDGSSKLEDRRDMVDAWQTNPDIFVFILSTRAGGLGINLTAADTVIFYDSDWNPTIDSQAMDRAHRLGQTKQVRVFRLITRGTIEERIRQRAQQKEEVQRVVIQGGDPGAKKSVDFKGTREVATWLFDKDEAEALETALAAKEKELEEQKAKAPAKGKAKKKKAAAATSAPASATIDIEDMYHEGEGRFDDSGKPSEAETPGPVLGGSKKRVKGKTNKKKTTQERLNMIDGNM